MNKVTLLSLSLLIISACNAMDPKPMGPEPKVFGTETPRPNNKITKFIVGSLIQSNPQGWSRRNYGTDILYNPDFKRLALDPKAGGFLRKFTDWWRYGNYKGDYLVDTTDKTNNDINSMKIAFGLEKSDNPARKRELTHFFTHFEVKGHKKIQTFEKRFNFKKEEAHDNQTECEQTKEIRQHGEVTREYFCNTNVSFDDLAKDLDELDKFVKEMDEKESNPVVIPPHVSKEELEEMRAHSRARHTN